MRGAGLPGRRAPLGGPAVRHPPPARPHPVPLARLPAQRLCVPSALPGPGHRGLHPAGNTGQARHAITPQQDGSAMDGRRCGEGGTELRVCLAGRCLVRTALHSTPNRCTRTETSLILVPSAPAMQYWRAVEVLRPSFWPCYSGVMADRSILYNCFHYRPVQPHHSPLQRAPPNTTENFKPFHKSSISETACPASRT